MFSKKEKTGKKKNEMPGNQELDFKSTAELNVPEKLIEQVIGQDDAIRRETGKEGCAEGKLVSYNEQRAKKTDCKEVEAWRMT